MSSRIFLQKVMWPVINVEHFPEVIRGQKAFKHAKSKLLSSCRFCISFLTFRILDNIRNNRGNQHYSTQIITTQRNCVLGNKHQEILREI